EENVDVLVLGGGIAGCWAAITAAKKGAKVAMIEKGATIRGGAGGSSCEHWGNAPNPLSPITPEMCVAQECLQHKGYCNGLSLYIMARESYGLLLEMEKMGATIRDTEDKFKGKAFRDEDTKFLFDYEYENRLDFRVWGETFKPVLYKECKRSGVKIYDRIMATSLLTEAGKQGGRVVGATGLNSRTGQFLIFRAKATIMCMSKHVRNWNFGTELAGLSGNRPNLAGTGHAMAWRAGATFTEMEKYHERTPSNIYSFARYTASSTIDDWEPTRTKPTKGLEFMGGGLVVDWDLKTTLDGLYAAGDGLFASVSQPHAAATGCYAARKAVLYAKQVSEVRLNRKQIDKEKVRVYAPTKHDARMDWKELNIGTCRVMQEYCGKSKSDDLLNRGLIWLEEIEQKEAPKLYATNPHSLMRSLEVLDVLTCNQMIMHASLARKASSSYLNFLRLDYPQIDPPDWYKWITIHQENGQVEVGELPIDFWGDLEENYEAHNSA
ncbi:FAD-dependent oxidoreductase, partial [Chloroflexota bacterium]